MSSPNETRLEKKHTHTHTHTNPPTHTHTHRHVCIYIYVYRYRYTLNIQYTFIVVHLFAEYIYIYIADYISCTYIVHYTPKEIRWAFSENLKDLELLMEAAEFDFSLWKPVGDL